MAPLLSIMQLSVPPAPLHLVPSMHPSSSLPRCLCFSPLHTTQVIGLLFGVEAIRFRALFPGAFNLVCVCVCVCFFFFFSALQSCCLGRNRCISLLPSFSSSSSSSPNMTWLLAAIFLCSVLGLGLALASFWLVRGVQPLSTAVSGCVIDR